MTLKEQIVECIRKYGPQTHAELGERLKALGPSVRRACADLAKENKIAPSDSKTVRRWELAEEVEAKPAKKESAKAETKKAQPAQRTSTMPKPTPAKRVEPTDPNDWRGWVF